MKEFPEQAVQPALAQELTIPESARRPAGLGNTRCSVTDLEAEVPRLKRKLVDARVERDILRMLRRFTR